MRPRRRLGFDVVLVASTARRERTRVRREWPMGRGSGGELEMVGAGDRG